MSRKVQSIRGETVDFDLIDIKNRIMKAPTPDSVQQRERFIDKRRRRNSRKRVDEMIAQQQLNEASVRTALDEQRQRNEDEKKSRPHVVVSDTVVTATQTEEAEATEVGTEAKPRRKIRRT